MEIGTRGRLAVWLGMLAILLVAAAIRLPPLPTKDISFADEGSHLQEGRLLASLGAAALNGVGLAWPVGGDPAFAPVPRLEWPTRWGPLRGEPLLSVRPGHSALVGLAMLLAGERPLAGQLASALLGVATVAMVFAIGRRLYGPPAGLLAAGALALSGWHALYSTQALSEVDSLFFAALSLWLYLGAHRHRLLWTGLALGAAFLTNPRLWILAPFPLLADWLCRRAAPSGRLPQWGSYTGGFLAPLALAAAVDELSIFIAGTSLFGNYLHATFSTVAMHVQYLVGSSDLGTTAVVPRASLPERLSIYPYLTWAWDGVLLTGLTALGLFSALWHRRPTDRLMLLLFAGAFLGQTFLTPTAARFFLMLALPAALLVGRSLLWLPASRRHLGAAVLLALLTVEGIPRAASLASVSSGYRGAAAFVVQESGGKHLSNQPSITGFYTGQANARWLSEDLEAVQRDVAEGYYLAVVALRPGLSAAAPWGERPEVQQLLPIARVPNPYGDTLQNLVEAITIPLSHRLNARPHSSGAEILVYDLRPLLAPPSPPLQPDR